MDRAKPGGLKIANEGPKSFGGMTTAWLTKLAGAKCWRCPITSIHRAQDTMGGTTDLSVQAVAAVSQFVKQGDLKAIVITSAQRMAGYEEVPTVAETYPGFEMTGWFILVTPAGTPPG